MSEKSSITPVYAFDTSVFVKFPDRTDFKLARYSSISLAGFSCFCSKPLDIGETVRVEINLKMLSGGSIDDTEPHVATAEFVSSEEEFGKSVYRFKFIEFEENCFDNLIKALDYLDHQEKIIPLPVVPKESVENAASMSLEDLVSVIMENIRKGQFVLPVLPKIVRDVKAVTSNPEASIDELANVIKKDSVISVKVLSTVNSPFYRARQHIVSIRDTVARLGFRETGNLVLTIAGKSLFNAKNRRFKRYLERLWAHSLATAQCAREIAEKSGVTDVDTCYTAGLIHDTGQTLLMRFLSEMLPPDHPASEKELFEIMESSNPKACRLILKHWEYSDEFINAVSFHHDTNGVHPEDKTPLVVDAANRLARNLGYGLITDSVEMTSTEPGKHLGLTPDDYECIGSTVTTLMESSGNVF